VPVLATPSVATAPRVVLFVGEATQDLGVLAHRIIGGRGGVARGSLVSVATEVLAQRAAPDAHGPPALVLANPGQLFWWPDGRRALSPAARHGVPLPSAVSQGVWFDPARNVIPGAESPDAHLREVFAKVLGPRMPADAKLTVIAVGDGAESVPRFLNDEANWARWGNRMQSLALVGGFFDRKEIKVEGFRTFLREVSA